MTRIRAIRAVCTYAALLLLSLPIGTAWHEVVGHGLVGVLCGGRIGFVEVLGVELWPDLRWTGWPEGYGACGVTDIPTAFGHRLTDLADRVPHPSRRDHVSCRLMLCTPGWVGD